MTELAQTLPGLRNYKAAVREWNDEIVFLRTIVEGGADRSYGIQVARLAGLPESVVRRAREILSDLEQRNAQHAAVVSASTDAQPDLFRLTSHPVIEELIHLDVLNITPIDALNMLDQLQRKARGE